jgi:hypothetical protein
MTFDSWLTLYVDSCPFPDRISAERVAEIWNDEFKNRLASSFVPATIMRVIETSCGCFVLEQDIAYA